MDKISIVIPDEKGINLEMKKKPEQIDLKMRGGSGTGNYNSLTNKPSINDVELVGNKTFDELGDHTLSNLEIKEVFDRVFKGE